MIIAQGNIEFIQDHEANLRTIDQCDGLRPSFFRRLPSDENLGMIETIGAGSIDMVYLSRIYTKTGDDGFTTLGDGARVSKDDIRVAAFGAVDETNAMIGMLRQNLLPEKLRMA